MATPHLRLHRRVALDRVYLCLGVEALPTSDPDRHVLDLLNTVLGDGANSRLFQAIREELGLAYTISSEVLPFRDTGALSIYAGCAARNTPEVLKGILGELRRLKDETVGEPELDLAKEQMKTALVLDLEDLSDRAENLAYSQIYFGRIFGLDEIAREIDAVTPEAVQALAQKLFRTEALALTLLGDLSATKIKREDLAC